MFGVVKKVYDNIILVVQGHLTVLLGDIVGCGINLYTGGIIWTPLGCMVWFCSSNTIHQSTLFCTPNSALVMVFLELFCSNLVINHLLLLNSSILQVVDTLTPSTFWFLLRFCIVFSWLYSLMSTPRIISGFGFDKDFYCSNFWRAAPILGNDSSWILTAHSFESRSVNHWKVFSPSSFNISSSQKSGLASIIPMIVGVRVVKV